MPDFKTPNYGLRTWASLFTARQITALTTLGDLVAEARDKVFIDAEARWPEAVSRADNRSLEQQGSGPAAYAETVATYLAFALGRCEDYGSTITTWSSSGEFVRGTFARQALPMAWDYCETNLFSGSSGNWLGACHWTASALEGVPALRSGEITSKNAAENNFPAGTAFSTDPPYYDNIGYADLSDYFYVWLRRTIAEIHPSLFRRVLAPKAEELVATPYRHGGRDAAEAFFMAGMQAALSGIANATTDVPVAIYYAFKQSEAGDDGVTSAGWATFLQAVADNGLMIDGTWPVRSERTARTIASGKNALASSIVLACRKREIDAEKIAKTDFLRRLRSEMPDALRKIRAAGVGPTDIQQAAIGPGIGIFTRYEAVLNPDGSAMSVRDALKLVNQVREELASEAQGDYDAPTRFAIDWFMAHGHKVGIAGDAILMANALGLGLADLERAGIFKTREGHAQLMSRDQLSGDWSPSTDRYPTAWEACQHLIRRLEAADGGVDAAAALFAELGDLGDPAHQLAFRLYDICNNKGWAAEAQPYNNLIQEWEVIEERALAFAPVPPAQGEMVL